MKKIKVCLFFFLLGAIIFNVNACSTASKITILDFNSGTMKNNLQGESGTWLFNPEDTEQGIKAGLDEKVRIGKEGASLRLEYDVASPLNAINGFWTQLRTFDASRYDHFEFWVKGDKKRGYPKTFKIEFKKIKKDEEGQSEAIKGSYIVKDVTHKWQKISVPLNVMNGILDWRDIREFVITFEK
ncbi:MAG: hypothetical protein KAU58_05805, partial [Candidatus Omnitrophica bacterium]|nr:hypothetical protein [Candidatus Omnitrophota bacterium]